MRAYCATPTGSGILRIEGKALQLSEFGPERVYIRGEIAGWQYEDAAGCGNP